MKPHRGSRDKQEHKEGGIKDERALGICSVYIIYTYEKFLMQHSTMNKEYIDWTFKGKKNRILSGASGGNSFPVENS